MGYCNKTVRDEKKGVKKTYTFKYNNTSKLGNYTTTNIDSHNIMWGYRTNLQIDK